jgi:hypothetical protein
MFHKINIETADNLFDALSSGSFETIALGRRGAILVSSKILIPVVRSTTEYKQPAQLFNSIHQSILSNLEHKFNNGMIEIYDDTYKTMGFHSDQALDLAPGSHIAIYSCYKNPAAANRQLIVKNKITSEIQTIPLDHNSIVVFSTSTNSQYLHKIVLQESTTRRGNLWLGITFRLSKTFVYDTVLRMATEIEKKEFYKMRSDENKSVDFTYPAIPYTISPSDLLPVADNLPHSD